MKEGYGRRYGEYRSARQGSKLRQGCATNQRQGSKPRRGNAPIRVVKEKTPRGEEGGGGGAAFRVRVRDTRKQMARGGEATRRI